MWSTGFAKLDTPLMFLCDGAGPHALDRCMIAQELINRGAHLEACDQHGDTPFLLAAAAGFRDMMEVLVKAGARIHVLNAAGVGARGRSAPSSGSTSAYLAKLGVVATRRSEPSSAPRGKSNGLSQKVRQARQQHCEKLTQSAT